MIGDTLGNHVVNAIEELGRGPGGRPPPSGGGRPRAIAMAVHALALAGGATLLAMPGCRETGAPPSEASSRASAAADAAVTTGADTKPSLELLSAAIDAQNNFGRPDAYLETFGTDATPRHPYHVAINPPHAVMVTKIDQLEATLARQPGEDVLHVAARGYVKAARVLTERLAEADRYYRRGDQKDDGWKKGDAMHGPVLAAHREFFAAADALDAETTRLSEERYAREVAELNGAGRTYRLHMVEVVHQTREVVDLLQASQDLAKVDRERLTAALAKLEKTVDEIAALAKDGDGAKRELGITGSLFGRVASESEACLTTAKEAARMLRASKGSRVGGQDPRPELVYHFNTLVEASNSFARR